ncbi:MAG TPA: TrmH family RNA methyltransferase [Vicinamibacteria bacterium]|nr:TrmH family RNA methyltransferase [Vicinamibacteria bacterium]
MAERLHPLHASGGAILAVRVVLVRPETPQNIGAVARVVRNTGLEGLDLVAPGDWRTVECWRSAWSAHEVLEGAREFRVLDEALADATFTAAFSGRRDKGVAVTDVRDLAHEVAALSEEDRAALVFGPEVSGLTLEELSRCGRRVRIPSHAAQPSMNLSHAVMVAAYEVFRAGRRPVAGTRRATHAEKERMLGLLRDGLLARRALPEANADGYFLEWRALFERADLTPKEVRLLEHMARKMRGG